MQTVTISELSPYERWMVKSNLDTIATTDVTAEQQAAQLRANGYQRVAEAVRVLGVAAEWREKAERLERYAQGCRRDGVITGPEGAEDAEAAALDYRREADLLEAGA